VTAHDKASSKKESIEIKNKGGRLSDSEIERLIKEAEEFEEADKIIKEKVDTRNSLESYVHSMTNQIEDPEKLAKKLSDDEKSEIKEVLDETRDWLK